MRKTPEGCHGRAGAGTLAAGQEADELSFRAGTLEPLSWSFPGCSPSPSPLYCLSQQCGEREARRSVLKGQ